jgi:hypothetical protein
VESINLNSKKSISAAARLCGASVKEIVGLEYDNQEDPRFVFAELRGTRAKVKIKWISFLSILDHITHGE